MPLALPGVTGAKFVAVVKPTILSPMAMVLPITVPFDFSNVANLQVISGSYSPNNDEHVIVTGIPQAASPNFYIFLCDGLAVFGDQGYEWMEMPVTKFSMGTFAVETAPYFIRGFVLNGRTNFTLPMAQGTPVNFTLVFGQATIA